MTCDNKDKVNEAILFQNPWRNLSFLLSMKITIICRNIKTICMHLKSSKEVNYLVEYGIARGVLPFTLKLFATKKDKNC